MSSCCELCGKRNEALVYSFVEGVKLQVCSKCAGFGKFAGEVQEKDIEIKKERDFFKKEEKEEEVVVLNFAELIRGRREKLGLSQKEFSMKLNEKESFIAHIESGNLPLNIETAKKIGKIIGLSLVQKEKELHIANKKDISGALTIGDLIKDE